MDELKVTRNVEHGGRCDCELLAHAVRVAPSVISFEYCQRVLQRHWRMTCRHGAPASSEPCPSTHQWEDMGLTDPVKAILVSNTPTGE